MAKKRTLPDFIQKRRRRYYAVLEIPSALRHHYPGKRPGKHLVRLVRSLETDSLAVAQRRAGVMVASWRSEFARLRNEGDDAAFYRRRLQKAGTDAERQQIMAEIEFAADNIGRPAYPYGPTDNPHPSEVAAIEEAAHDRGQDFYSRATGQLVGFTDHLEAFLERQATTDKTKAMVRTDVTRFASSFPTVQDVSADGVQRWVDALGLAPTTIKRTLSSIRGYWKYLQRPDVKAVAREVQPFTALDLPKPRNGPKDRRKPFEPRDVIKLLFAAHKDTQLQRLIQVGMWTGCRIEEICSLKTERVFLEAAIPYLDIADAKTPAGWRQVPVHNALLRPMADLVKESTDGFLLSGLSVDKFGDRSNTIGHRFGRLKTSLGFDKRYVFHSIRKTVSTLLENAGVSENLAADILGHDKPRITYGLYSGGSSLEVKAEALAKLNYGTQS